MLGVLAIEIRRKSWHRIFHATSIYITIPGIHVPQADGKHTEQQKTAENLFSLATLQDPKRSTPSDELGASREDLPNVLLSYSMSCQRFVGSQCEFADQTGRKGEDIDMFAERTLVIREEKVSEL